MPYMDYTLKDLPQDVRELALSAVRTLAERGPRGLVEDGLCPPEAEDSFVENRNLYPGKLIEPPDSAELDYYIRANGIWRIDIPLHNDVEGRIDLFIFLEVDPQARSVKVTGLYTP
jgi:hypothetical protein